MARSGKPFDVPDAEVRAEIERAYAAMLEEDAQQLIRPMVDHLQTLGYAVATYGSLPSITAKLPRRIILSLAQRPDVGMIYLNEGEGEDQ